MFDFSWSELLVIGIVALVFIGPKELPSVLRTLGQWMAKVRRMASEFQNQFQDAMREAELADLKKEVDNMASDYKFDPLDPLADVRKDVERTEREIESALAVPSSEPAVTKAASVQTGADEAAVPSPTSDASLPAPQAADESPAIASAGEPGKEPAKEAAAGSERA
jgi:sec-independent protein translocase protein TatB